MKKTLTAVALASILSSPALASEPCDTKMNNAASFELAQALGVPVQQVKVNEVVPGPWTKMTEDNHGSATITVEASAQGETSPKVATYRVEALQIGTSTDCNIIGVEAAD